MEDCLLTDFLVQITIIYYGATYFFIITENAPSKHTLRAYSFINSNYSAFENISKCLQVNVFNSQDTDRDQGYKLILDKKK